ncbi:DUF4252 domain-containing protein [Hymenobacter sp. BT175]|uniref:DUF4252 domain-containing protein n=1 Tax=Hymenobacter translucens TaxID=2886507 RepID=UPI001D0EC513|nr:DUF4252 domain-containing protein [Hymenobacter translucens]MCC2546906.1 DUF4252 domain-containing protein [Hymenobacter translucens]
MKTRFLSILALFGLLVAASCRTAGPEQPARTVAEFFNKYQNRSGFRAGDWNADLTTRLLLGRLGKWGGDNNVTQALSAIRGVRFITFAPTSSSSEKLVSRGLITEVDGLLSNERYTQIPVSPDAGSTNLRYAARMQGEQVQEVVVSGQQENIPDSFVLLAINGNFTREQLTALQKVLPNVMGEITK